jgi:hypothetical protein
MKIANRSLLEVIDLSSELLENVNGRLIQLDQWRIDNPAWRTRIDSLYKEGIEVGSLLKAVDFEDKSLFSEITRKHDQFFVNFEHLWRLISASTNGQVPISLRWMNNQWVVQGLSFPDMFFASKEGAWAYISGISCGQHVIVSIFSKNNELEDTIQLNAAVI